MLVFSFQQTISIFYGGATFPPLHPSRILLSLLKPQQPIGLIKAMIMWSALLVNVIKQVSELLKRVVPTWERGKCKTISSSSYSWEPSFLCPQVCGQAGCFYLAPRMHNGGRTNTILSASERLVGSSLAGWKGKHIFGEIHIRERVRIPYSFSYQHKELSKLLNVRKLITDTNMSWA